MTDCICHPLHRCGRCDESCEGGEMVNAPEHRPVTDGRIGVPGSSPGPHTIMGNGSLKKRPAALVNTPLGADVLQTASAVPTPTDRPRCPECKSPDYVPYNFGSDVIAALYRQLYPNARKCMDCDYVGYGE